jgi:hypothetical protein
LITNPDYKNFKNFCSLIGQLPIAYCLLSIVLIILLTPFFRTSLTMKRSGSADLPLHNGYVPDWLYQSMSKLGFAITEAIITEYGKEEFLRRMCVGGLPTGKVGMG